MAGYIHRGFKLKTDDSLNDHIDSDPIPLQKSLEAYLKWRYGVSEEMPKTLGQDLQAIDTPKGGLTVKQVARLLNRQVQTVRDRYIAEGKLRATKTPAKQLSIDPQDLLEFVEANRDNFPLKVVQEVRKLVS